MDPKDNVRPAPILIQSTRSRARLENLPGEIMDLLLESIPDALSLRALIHASPLYHSLYVHRRRLILSSVLQNDLSPPCLIIALVVEEGSWFPDGDYDDVRMARVPLMKRYLAQRSKVPVEGPFQDVSLENIISIFRRHQNMQHIAAQYAAEKLSMNPVSKRVVQNYVPPSRDESHRIYRALYNFQFYCLLFASKPMLNSGPDRKQRIGLLGPEHMLSQRYLPNISAWEVEEVACIREYLFDNYSRVWQDCKATGVFHVLRQNQAESKESPEIQDPQSWESPIKNQIIEHWLSLGLDFFRRVSCTPEVERQAEALLENAWRRMYFLTLALGGKCYKYRTMCAAHPLGFNHASSTKDDTPRHGPWLDISDFGLPDQGRDYRRSWGYVLWDRQRIEAWKEDSQSASQPANEPAEP